jgi:hypothetical protein
MLLAEPDAGVEGVAELLAVLAVGGFGFVLAFCDGAAPATGGKVGLVAPAGVCVAGRTGAWFPSTFGDAGAEKFQAPTTGSKPGPP